MSEVALGDDDQRIAAALLVNPRATWPQISDALDMPVSTVSRRGRRLIERRTVRPVATTDVIASRDGFPVLMQISTEQHAVQSVAAHLVDRNDFRTVTIAAGPTQCTAEAVVSSHKHLAHLITEELPGISGLTSVSTFVAIRRFTTSHAWNCGILPKDQVDRLLAGRVDRPAPDDRISSRVVTDIDRQVIAAFNGDGRAPWRKIAQHTGLQERTVQRRATALMEAGILRTRTIAHPEHLGFNVAASIWLNIDPSHLEQVGTDLSRHPAVTLLVSTTGQFNLCGELLLRDNAELYRFMTDTLGSIPGDPRIDTTLSLNTLKRMGFKQP